MIYTEAIAAQRPRKTFALQVRRAHRWLSIAFTAAVAANFVVMMFARPPAVMVYLPAPLLVLMMASGLFMFAKSRGASACNT